MKQPHRGLCEEFFCVLFTYFHGIWLPSKTFLWKELNEPVKSCLQRVEWSLVKFINFTLCLSGSSYTMAVISENRTPPTKNQLSPGAAISTLTSTKDPCSPWVFSHESCQGRPTFQKAPADLSPVMEASLVGSCLEGWPRVYCLSHSHTCHVCSSYPVCVCSTSDSAPQSRLASKTSPEASIYLKLNFGWTYCENSFTVYCTFLFFLWFQNMCNSGSSV